MPDRHRLTPEELRAGIRRGLYAAFVILALFLGPLLIRSCVARFLGE